MDTSHKNNIIRKIIQYIHNEPIKFNKNRNNDIQITFTNQQSIMTLCHDSKWDEIKRYIDSIMTIEKNNICSICSTDNIILQRVKCRKCSSEMCMICFKNIIITNKGIIKCPYCRHEVNTKM
jgi:DNA-directed RNA polymerase subunit RPC12/RpoP